MADKDLLALRRIQTEGYIRINRLQRYMNEHVAELLADEGLSDLTPAQANVLVVLFNEGKPMLARRIAEALALSEVTVGRFVHSLHRKGWVTRRRDEQDGRSYRIAPTQKAVAALPRMINGANRGLERAFGGISESDTRLIVALVRKLTENLGHADDIPEVARPKPVAADPG